MEYVYAALLLHKAGKPVDEASVKKVVEAAGIKVEDGKVKALVAALKNVSIEEAIKNASIAAPAAAPAEGGEKKEERKEEKKEEKKDDGAAAAGLGALFG